MHDFRFVDPFEIQCWPPSEVDQAMDAAGIEYPHLLDAIAGLLVSRSPRFAQDLAPYLASYMHPHNWEGPLDPADEAGLRAMIARPETLDPGAFRRLVPLVLRKATTLATETFVQTRPGWVLKALPNLHVVVGATGW